MTEKTQVQLINDQVNKELADPKTNGALLATTFKGLSVDSMKQAIVEGMIRGFSFKNFLQKDVYAVPFKNGYSLVTSIDYARKIGMASGIMGKKAPEFEMSSDGKKIISCTVTVQRLISGHIGDFTATVFFDEYYKSGKNGYPSLWDSKPRTMIAKVAEMHALRMACPEELSKQYTEEEIDPEIEATNAPIQTASKLVEESNLKMKDLEKDEGKTKKDKEDEIPPWRSESVEDDIEKDGEPTIKRD